MFESMPGVDGEVTDVDVDNYIAAFDPQDSINKKNANVKIPFDSLTRKSES